MPYHVHNMQEVLGLVEDQTRQDAELQTHEDAAVAIFVAAGYGAVDLANPLGVADITDAGWTTMPLDTEVISPPRGVEYDLPNNSLAFESEGVWQMNIIVTLTFIGINSGRTMLFRLFNIDLAIPGPSTAIFVGRNTDGATLSFPLLFEIGVAAINDFFRIELSAVAGDSFTGVIVIDANLGVAHVSEFRGDLTP